MGMTVSCSYLWECGTLDNAHEVNDNALRSEKQLGAAVVGLRCSSCQ